MATHAEGTDAPTVRAGATAAAPGPLAPASPREPAPATTPPGRIRRLMHVTLPGCWGAAVFAALSFTPSLLPRGGFIQGLICGITAAIGYGLGVLAAWLWRAYADREPRPARPSSWRLFLVGAGVLLAVAFALGQYWQSQIRSLMGVTEYNV